MNITKKKPQPNQRTISTSPEYFDPSRLKSLPPSTINTNNTLKVLDEDSLKNIF